MPKATRNRAETQRHNPLADDIAVTGPLRTKSNQRRSKHEENEEEAYVDSKASNKILRMAQELEEESGVKRKPSSVGKAANPAFQLDSRIPNDEEDEAEDVTYDDEEWGDDEEEEVVEEMELSPEDLRTFQEFNPQHEDPLLRHGWDGPGQEIDDERPDTWLADLMLQKIAEKEARDARTRKGGDLDRMSDAGPEDQYVPPPKVVETYTQVGYFMSRYKSGKLPKLFKILPTLPNWEIIIQITQPEKWTANACYEATRLFVSGAPATVTKFMQMIMLERVRTEIYETKKLNVHLFNALKRSLYKPASFFKGFLFPLVRDGDCTLREAQIISGVLVRVSIPMLHSAAAIKGLCDIAAQEDIVGNEGGGATNIFIKALLEKKYALPYQVIDALTFHFLRFRRVASFTPDVAQGVTGLTERQAKKTHLPVIWHQCFLAFAQRYRNDITEDQREALLDLLLEKGHAKIAPEIRRELLEGRGRGFVKEESKIVDGDDTMQID